MTESRGAKAIRLVKLGKSVEDAAKEAGVSLYWLKTLIDRRKK